MRGTTFSWPSSVQAVGIQDDALVAESSVYYAHICGIGDDHGSANARCHPKAESKRKTAVHLHKLWQYLDGRPTGWVRI